MITPAPSPVLRPRGPAWMALAWLLAGPLNPMVVPWAYYLLPTPIDTGPNWSGAWLWIGLPSMLGTSLAFWRLRRGAVTGRRIVDLASLCAVVMFCLGLLAYGVHYGLVSGLEDPDANALSLARSIADGILFAIFAGIFSGIAVALGFVSAMPAAMIGVLPVRYIAFTRERVPTPAAPATQMPAAPLPPAP